MQLEHAMTIHYNSRHSPQHQVRTEHTDSGGPTLRWLAREVKFAPPDPKAPPTSRPVSSVSGVERMARVRQVGKLGLCSVILKLSCL